MAHVQKQLVPVQFGGGINTKVDPKQLQAGQLNTLVNGQFSKQGQINKRYGYTILSNQIQGGGTIAAGVELATFKNELLLFDGSSVYSYMAATGNWANRGTAISIITRDVDIIRTQSAQQLNPDMAYCLGIEVYAWEDSRGGVYYSVRDTTTGAFAVSGVQLAASGQQPKCVTFAGLVYIFYASGSALSYQTVAPGNPTAVSVATTLATNGYAGTNGFPFDVAAFTSTSGASLVGFAYVSTVGGSSVTIGTLTVGGTATTSTVQAVTMATHGAVNLTIDSYGTGWCSWSNGSHVYTQATTNFGATSAALASLATVYTGNVATLAGIESYTAGVLLLFYEVVNATAYLEQTQYATVTTGGIVSGASTLYSVGLASKPWSYLGKIFINTCYDSTLQSTDFTWYIPSTGSPVIVSKMTPGVGGGLQTNGMTPETVQISSGVYKFANLLAGKIISEADTLFTLLGVNSTQITHSPTDNFINTTQANTLLVVGGVLQGYDGTSVTELGFHLYPENIAGSPGSVGSLGAGSYQYIVEYQWTDNNGQIYRSAPSVPITVTTTAGQAVALTGPYLCLTSKATAISIVIYRTLVNGSIFYRVTSTLAPLLNSTTGTTWSFKDTLSDTSASSNDVDYTTGGVLANIAPPANAFLVTYNNRVFLGGLSDKLSLWYSQTVVDNSNANTVPPQFCAELTVACDPRGGDITALGLLNQTLVIFKANEIFAMSGNGPDATGNNSDYADPQLISSDVGCVNPNSVVVTSLGLFFQAERGIYLLDQSLNTSYIGAPVESFGTLSITSAVEAVQDSQIIFFSSSGTALVYDYYFQQWSTWTNHYANDGVIYQSLVTFVTPSGQVYQQNRSSFTDGAASVLMSWTLPDLSFGGLQGYQRVFRCFILGTYKGPHKLTVQVAYDFNGSYTQTATISPSSQSTWGSDPNWGSSSPWGGGYQLYEFRVDFSTQKCTAIRLAVSDAQSSNYNEGYAISSVVFEVGALPGGNRLPSTSTYGAS